MNVIWNEKELNVNQRIDANFKNVELKKVMELVSERLSMAYTFLGQNIIVKNRKVEEQRKPIKRAELVNGLTLGA